MSQDWYKDAVFYEVHVKAFADGDGNGMGDFTGLTSRLDYLRDLGVDCLWILPMYPSPLKTMDTTSPISSASIPRTGTWRTSRPSSMRPTLGGSA